MNVWFLTRYLSVIVVHTLLRNLAVQAEQHRVLQGEPEGESFLLQQTEGVFLSTATHRQCGGHEVPTQSRKGAPVLVWKKPWKRGGMLARTSAAEEVVVQVEILLTPGCYISCTRLELLLGAGPNTVNTAQAPPTWAFDLTFTSHRPTSVQTAARGCWYIPRTGPIQTGTDPFLVFHQGSCLVGPDVVYHIITNDNSCYNIRSLSGLADAASEVCLTRKDWGQRSCRHINYTQLGYSFSFIKIKE